MSDIASFGPGQIFNNRAGITMGILHIGKFGRRLDDYYTKTPGQYMRERNFCNSKGQLSDWLEEQEYDAAADLHTGAFSVNLKVIARRKNQVAMMA